MADDNSDWGRLLSEAASAREREWEPVEADTDEVLTIEQMAARLGHLAAAAKKVDLSALASRIADSCRDFRWGTRGPDHELVRRRWCELQAAGEREFEALHRARREVVEGILREGIGQ